ncbi:hypothetical protein IL54_2265 [Sphingobium sp. ba1]|nr:hypothetical protein IL54_2265 [Sphingobium sp. ba1]
MQRIAVPISGWSDVAQTQEG